MSDTLVAPKLLWRRDLGMGYLPIVAEQPYDAAYFAKYQAYAGTDMGRAITEARAALVRRHALGATGCDVGIGCGAFIEAAGGYGYDVNPVGIAWLKERGIWWDPYQKPVQALTCWDSLEHVREPGRLVRQAEEWVFCSLPIVPGDGPPDPDWRHYRPDEHRWYWTHSGFIEWMHQQGFGCAEHNRMETELGRLDIGSYAFTRIARVTRRST